MLNPFRPRCSIKNTDTYEQLFNSLISIFHTSLLWNQQKKDNSVNIIQMNYIIQMNILFLLLFQRHNASVLYYVSYLSVIFQLQCSDFWNIMDMLCFKMFNFLCEKNNLYLDYILSSPIWVVTHLACRYPDSIPGLSSNVLRAIYISLTH